MKESVLVVEGYSASLSIERGHLVVRDGFTTEDRREIHFPRGRCEIDRIIIRAPGGVISIPAVDWCARMGIAISFVASDSTLLNCMIPGGAHDGPLKRAQGYSAVTDDAVRLAQFLLTRKMESQIHAIGKDFGALGIGSDISRKAASSQIRSCIDSLKSAAALVDFLSIEGRASQVYWDLLVATPLPWREWSLKRIPAHWAAISSRTSGRRERVRDATDPYNAAINFAYTLAVVEMRIACEMLSIDVDLGLIHVDGRRRESCLYDLVEPLRAVADVGVLQLFHKVRLQPSLFHELRDGIVRLDPDLTGMLASALMPRFRKAALEIANDYAKQLRRITVPRRLVREAPKPIEQRRESWERAACGYCKEPLPRKGLKFCGRHCYLRYSIEVAKPIEKAQGRLAEMRAGGLNPGHGGIAAAKRGGKIAISNSRRALNLTPEEYRKRRAAQARERRRIAKTDDDMLRNLSR